jgi:hypothetical protein
MRHITRGKQPQQQVEEEERERTRGGERLNDRRVSQEEEEQQQGWRQLQGYATRLGLGGSGGVIINPAKALSLSLSLRSSSNPTPFAFALRGSLTPSLNTTAHPHTNFRYDGARQPLDVRHYHDIGFKR